MRDGRLIELINKYIDSELSAKEDVELKDLLLDNDNKKLFESMTQTINLLESNKPVEQQINIKEQVINRISRQKKESLSGKIKVLLSEIFNGAKIGYAVSFALGVLLVGIILMLQPGTGSVNDNFTKGVISNRNFEQTYSLNNQLLNGAVRVSYSRSLVILDIKLKTADAVDCQMDFDKNQFALYGVKNIELSSNGNFISGSGSVQLSNLGQNHYMVFLRKLNNNPGKVRALFYNGYNTVNNLTIDIKN